MENIKVRTYWNEEWKIIETKASTKEKNYYISNYGKVKSVNKKTGIEKELKGSLGKQGYRILNLKLKDDVRQGFYLHRLVGKYFIESPNESKEFLVHIDQNLQNNYFKNLKWLSRKELGERWKKLGIYKNLNIKNPKTKMTISKVKLLKQRLKKGKTKKRILAKQFDISVTQVNRIVSGENWGHVK